MSQVQGSETELAVGTLQWNVLFAAALCPPSRGLAPSPKRSLRGSGPKATEGGDFFGTVAHLGSALQALQGMEPWRSNPK